MALIDISTGLAIEYPMLGTLSLTEHLEYALKNPSANVWEEMKEQQ